MGEFVSQLFMEGKERVLRSERLTDRAHRSRQIYPEMVMFALAEEAARELAESDIRSTIGDTMENMARDMSEMLADAARSNDTSKLCSAAIRLFTLQTTLYRDVNFGLREYEETGVPLFPT
jgi:hypothetical protein